LKREIDTIKEVPGNYSRGRYVVVPMVMEFTVYRGYVEFDKNNSLK
jgi:hypothetical protein